MTNSLMWQVKSHAEEIEAASYVLLYDMNHNLSVVFYETGPFF